MTKPRRQPPFHDPVRVRHILLIAAALGRKKAVEVTGVSSAQIARWRTTWAAHYGETWPINHNPGNTGHGKLSLEAARIIRARRKAGVSSGVLGRLYKVSPSTIRSIEKGRLYPEPAADELRRAA